MRALASRPRQLLHLAVWWALLFGLWLLLAGATDGAELLVAALFSLPCALLATGLRRVEVIPFYPDSHWMKRVPAVAWGMLKDTWTLTVHLFRALRRGPREGGFASIERHWSPDDPNAERERAWITLAMTATPNLIVVGIDPDRGRILVHQLVPLEDPKKSLEAIL